jgi:hypothetical protein
MKALGIFAFTVEAQQQDQADGYAMNRVEVSEKPEAETAVTLFRHRDDYVASLLAGNGFVLLKTLKFLALKYPAENRDIFFKAYVAQKKGSCCAT